MTTLDHSARTAFLWPRRIDRIAERLQRLEAGHRQASSERQTLKTELDGAAERVAHALAHLDGEVNGGARDPTQILTQTIGRASRRIKSLGDELRAAEIAREAKASQIAHLQSQLARLREEKRGLEDRIAALSRENRILGSESRGRAEALAALAAAHNRTRNENFWSLSLFLARVPEFADYAEGVAYEPRRLFALLLRAEIDSAPDLSPEIKAEARAIADLFDPIFYLAQYPDVALSGRSPLLHYLADGVREGRRPHPFFDPDYYCLQKGSAPANPLLDYAREGSAAGLKPHPLFDPAYYRRRYPKIAKSGIEPLYHYEVWGGREGHDPSPLFDTEYYLARRKLPDAQENPLRDYLAHGGIMGADPHPLFSARCFGEEAGIADFAEAALALYQKRRDLWARAKPHPLFDPAHFAAELARLGFPAHDDLSPLESFCAVAAEADLSPHILFDAPLYRYQVEHELGRALAEPAIIDYLKRGWRDKTVLPNLLFDAETYIDAQGEVAEPELLHYLLEGDKAGARCHQMFYAGFYNGERADGAPITALEHFFREWPHGTLKSHPHMERPLDPAPIEWITSIYRRDNGMDADFYRATYTDLAEMSDVDCAAHFSSAGIAEGRYQSARDVVRRCGVRIRDMSLGFSAVDYHDLNLDLAALGTDFHPLFLHYVTTCRAERRTVGRWQFHLDGLELDFPTPEAPLHLVTEPERIEVCLLMHIFYADLWPELAAFAKNFDTVSRDVFVNVVDAAWTPQFHRELRELCPGAFVQLSNDDGRDIGGFIRLLDNVDLGRYRVCAFMHTKKSPHIPTEKGAHWRRTLLSAFAGSREVVTRSLAMFRNDPTVGLIGSKEWRSTDLGKNAEQYEKLLDLFEIAPEHREIEYLSGTMFMIRPEIVRHVHGRLKEASFEYGGDKSVEEHMDGQLAHGVERLIGNLVRQMGYRFVWT